MKKALLLNCSPHGVDARAYALARKAIDNLRMGEADLQVRERDLSMTVPSHIDCNYAAAVTSRSPHSAPAFEESEQLICELEGCDYLVISTPMYNFTVPAALKLWIDYVVRVDRTFAAQNGYKVGILKDRPALVITSSGGIHTGEHARQPDFLSPYLSHVLLTIGIKDVRFLHLQATGRPDIAALYATAAATQLAADPVFGECVVAL